MRWIATPEKDTATVTLEKRLWDAADLFRGNSGLKAQEYSGPILGLIFLRFALPNKEPSMGRSLASRIRAANLALIANGNLDAIGEFFTVDYVAHLTDRDMEGHDAIRRLLGMLRRAFPDLRMKVEVLLEGEKRVAWQRTLQGTHQGDLMGFPACGRRIVWRDMFTSRFRGGLIAEDWVVTDLAERLLLARKP